MAVPGQKYRVDLRDLDKNISIGLALPFSAPAAFVTTKSTKDQIKYNLINLLLTNKGERIENPEFGSNIRKYIFEFITANNIEELKNAILTSIATFIPEVVIMSIEATPETDFNTINLRINYKLKLSGTEDTVSIQFE